MRHRVMTIAVLGVVAALAVSSTALAAKGGGKPAPPDDTVWTCQARVDNGAVWVLDTADGSADYTVGGLPACIDLRAEDTGPHRWRVTWEGAVAREPMRGLKFVFETEVHGTVHAETVVTTTSGEWVTDVIDPPDEGFAFVAMPRRGDSWDRISITVTPLDPTP